MSAEYIPNVFAASLTSRKYKNKKGNDLNRKHFFRWNMQSNTNKKIKIGIGNIDIL